MLQTKLDGRFSLLLSSPSLYQVSSDPTDLEFLDDRARTGYGISYPSFIKEGTSTGITFEGHPGKVFTKAIEGGYEQLLENVDWRLWSTTRIPISAMPIRALQSGSVSRMFAGTDLLIAEGGPEDFTGDFDARFVFGGELGILGPGNTVFEIYMFQQDVPIAFALFYGF